MQLALIHIGQETNDFNPVPTTLRDYESFGIVEGADILRQFNGLGQIGGYIKAVEDSSLPITTIPIIRAWATAGGRIDRKSFEYFQCKIREGLESAGPIDGLALQLHGACAADGVDDVEGEQVALCREILGPDVPIVLGLDHHANITDRMVSHCNAIVGHRTQPHDPFDTGVIGTELLIRIVQGDVRACMRWRKIPLLSHQEQFLTDHGPMKVWFDRARAMEQNPKVLQASNYPMQPWLDVQEAGWATVVVTDDDPDLADACANELADLAWSMRDDFQVREALAIDDAVRRADAAEEGLVVLSDTGDTVFGGSAGDSNLILESMLRLGLRHRALVPLIEPVTAHALAQAGEGETVTISLGGHSAPAFFQPLSVTGIVRRVGGGWVPVSQHYQDTVDMGVTVVFDVGPVTLLISELRGVAGNLPDVYRALGVEPTEYHMAVLKTASNFQYFKSMTSEVIRVDTRGPGQSDVLGLPWQRIPRPMYPLDPLDKWNSGR
jgi:microcystin degradation protein MlrC